MCVHGPPQTLCNGKSLLVGVVGENESELISSVPVGDPFAADAPLCDPYDCFQCLIAHGVASTFVVDLLESINVKHDERDIRVGGEVVETTPQFDTICELLDLSSL